MSIWHDIQQIVTYFLAIIAGIFGILLGCGFHKNIEVTSDLQAQAFGLIFILFSMILQLSFKVRSLEAKLEKK